MDNEKTSRQDKNVCAKTRKPDKPYEIWTNEKAIVLGGVDRFEPETWYWYVLKKYQSPENERKNQYARWFCLVKSPIVPEGEYGDTYISDIVPHGKCIYREGSVTLSTMPVIKI